MATLLQLRSKVRVLISQEDNTDTDLTDLQIDGFLNEAQTFFATQTKHPVKTAEVNPQEGYDVYTLPSDYLLLRFALFGNPTVQGDIRRLKQYTPDVLTELRPSWYETASASRNRPQSITIISKYKALINPCPDSTYNSTNGYKFIIYYVYYPATMVLDGSSPDLPLAYHDHLALYACHLAYLGKLKNPDLATKFLTDCMNKIKLIEPASTKETEDLYFAFGNSDDLSTGDTSIIMDRG